MKVSVIAARSSNFVIGNGGDLAIRDRADLQNFANYTKNSVLIAGSETALGLPEKVYTTGFRHLVILSRKHADELKIQFSEAIAAEQISIAGSIQEALTVAERLIADFPEIYTKVPRIIGGGQVYKEIFLMGAEQKIIEEIRITEFRFPVEGDTFLFDFTQLTDANGEPYYHLVSVQPLSNSELNAEVAVYKLRRA
jgi:dihydrofolate reductase